VIKHQCCFVFNLCGVTYATVNLYGTVCWVAV
jgi:hypothetical protein